ncbi:phage integrase [Moraxella macacae 0408225]|uniref:Phage integrase n=1 Tax=Moraxella macacae 0408225 TaxID=1230338 RepID=L2F5V8_9GAMM|nr:hypothetical protein [Moraxella macacae]ELA08285.1 phage integrase [Moraxella macacae 0408225]
MNISIKGIRQRGTSIEIYFNWLGKKHFIKVNSIEQGIELREQILAHIKQGTLTKETLTMLTNPITFEHVVLKYLKYNQANKQTKRTYENILNHHWFELYPCSIESITTEQILDILCEKELSNKYINQILIPLRGVFDTAMPLRLGNNPFEASAFSIFGDADDVLTADVIGGFW